MCVFSKNNLQESTKNTAFICCSCRGRGAKNSWLTKKQKSSAQTVAASAPPSQASCASMVTRLKAIPTSEVKTLPLYCIHLLNKRGLRQVCVSSGSTATGTNKQYTTCKESQQVCSGMESSLHCTSYACTSFALVSQEICLEGKTCHRTHQTRAGHCLDSCCYCSQEWPVIAH